MILLVILAAMVKMYILGKWQIEMVPMSISLILVVGGLYQNIIYQSFYYPYASLTIFTVIYYAICLFLLHMVKIIQKEEVQGRCSK